MKKKQLDKRTLNKNIQLNEKKTELMQKQRNSILHKSEKFRSTGKKKTKAERIVPTVKGQKTIQNNDLPKVRNNDRRVPNGTITCSIGLRIEQETNEKLIDLCFREGISKSALIKRLIRQYIEENIDS